MFLKPAKKNKKTKRNRRMTCENLETRKLFAVVSSAVNSRDDLIVKGTNSSDTIDVYYSGSSKQNVTVRSTTAGKRTYKTFARKDIDYIRVYGNNGNDKITNHTSLKSSLYGGNGNDTIVGGSNKDYISGYRGNDKLYGRAGSDTILGGSGDDLISGWTGNDTLRGDSGKDTIYGYKGNDTIQGGSGDDWITGHEGHDQIFGNSGNDTLYGYKGNDEIHGGPGNDMLSGWSGHDDLYGDSGTDRLYGHSGDDGLFGGVGAKDRLDGGSGDDRFLTMSSQKREGYWKSRWHAIIGKRSYRTMTQFEDTIVGRTSNDAIVEFRNTGATSTRANGFGTVRFAAGRWSDGDVKVIDTALNNLHQETGNTKLLKKATGQSLVMQRMGRQLTRLSGGVQIAGLNGGGVISFTSAGMRNSLGAIATTYHEIGHNWDTQSENRYINAFRRISRWDQKRDRGDRPSLQTGDNWFYNDSVNDFARPVSRSLGGSYSTWNPREDYATTFETNLLRKYHNTTNGSNWVDSKQRNVDAFFRSIS